MNPADAAKDMLPKGCVPGEIGCRVDFLPISFKLPGDYRLFVEEFKRYPGSAWIMKPVGSAQGKGIFLMTKLSQIEKWKTDTRFDPTISEEDLTPEYIVQQYIYNPCLIGGKKFDLRIYALVTSYSPLKIYLYREAFARFTFVTYSMADLDNTAMHLTNVAIQKKSAEYDQSKGCKWLFSRLKRYLATVHGHERAEKLARDIDNVIITTIASVQKVLMNDKRCFELYGFDILLDATLKPWLCEVNASPSLTADTSSDYELKFGMLNDMLNVVDMEKR